MLDTILTYLLPVLASILTALASLALTALAKKYKLEVDLGKDAVLRASIRNVIFAVEELAAGKLKINTAKTNKAVLALEYLSKMFPNKLPEELERLLHEELGKIPDMGAHKHS